MNPPDKPAQNAHVLEYYRRGRPAPRIPITPEPRPPDDLNVTRERLEKAGDDFEDFITDSDRHTIRLVDRNVLDLLLSRKSIQAHQYNAGMRICKQFADSGQSIAAIDTTKEFIDGRVYAGQSVRQLDAITALKKARRAVGRVHWHAISHLLLQEVTLEAYGRWRWNMQDSKAATQRSIGALTGSLDQLDNHYHGKRRRLYRESHAEDYRPKVSAKA